MENSNFQLSNLEDLLKLLKNDSDSTLVQKYTKILKTFVENQSSDMIENEDILLVINDSINILTKQVFEVQNNESKNLFLELLILLSFLKLNFLNKDCIEYCSTAVSIVNNGIKLVKFFNDSELYEKAEYFCCKCKIPVEMLLTKNIQSNQFPIKNSLMETKMTLDVYLIEALSNSDKLNEAFDEIQNIRQSISKFSNHKDYFFRLCYNVGVKLIRKEQYENAIVILETVRDIIDDSDAFISIETCKLLAYIFTKYKPDQNWNGCIDALNAIPAQNLQASSIIYLIKAALLSNNEKIVKETLFKINETPNISMELIIKIHEDLQSNHYHKLSIEFLKNARERKFDIGEKLHLMCLELKIYFKNNRLEEARDLSESAIEIVKLHPEMNPEAVNGICKEISAYSSVAFKSGAFAESLRWYKTCNRLLEVTKVCDASALQYILQRICLCHIEMREIDSAKRVLASLDPLSDSTDPFNVYLALQVALVAEDEELAGVVLSHIGGKDANSQRILLNSCKLAFDTGNKYFLCKILETVLQKSNANAFLQAKIAQCLVRMHLDTSEKGEHLEKIINFIKKGLDSLQNCQHQHEEIDLASWFSRVSWNLVLGPGLDPLSRFRLSLLCCRMLELALAPAPQLRGAFVLGAAAGIQVLEHGSEDAGEIIRQVLSLIDRCRHLESAGCPAPSVLWVCEFETRLRAGDSIAALLALLRRMQQDARVDAATLENAAALAYEHDPVANHKLISAALRGSAQKALERQDAGEVARMYHSLLQVLFHNHEFEGGSEDETFEVCEGLARHMEAAEHEYPPMEVLWVMGKCWNWGVLSLSSGKDPRRAEGWCRLALRCSHGLQGLEPVHGRKMAALYAAHFGDSDADPPQNGD